MPLSCRAGLGLWRLSDLPTTRPTRLFTHQQALALGIAGQLKGECAELDSRVSAVGGGGVGSKKAVYNLYTHAGDLLGGPSASKVGWASLPLDLDLGGLEEVCLLQEPPNTL